MTPEEQSIHLVGRLAKLERELAAERALADRLAEELKAASDYINFETEYFEDESALTAWKEAREP